MLIIHISIAILSILFASASLLRPTYNKLITSYISVGATLVSGTYLVLSTKSSMISACISGLIYTTIVVAALHMAERRLQSKKIK